LARASKIMAPTSCFTGQVHRLPDAPQAYGAMITRAKAAPPQSRSADLVASASAVSSDNPILEQAEAIYSSLVNIGHKRPMR
jgi:hypothetical protein